MAITERTTLAELAGEVSEKLKAKGLSAILVGGGVVSIYTDNRYESGDLDFVVEQFVVRKGLIDEAMAELGFTKDRGRVYLHPKCRYAVDFSPPPVSIGEEVITQPAKYKAKTGVIRLFTPTQSVMDRLAAYYHFDDAQGLEQAVLVASSHPVKLDKIAEWSKAEGHREKHETFRQRLLESKRRRK
ncbi:MAG TPA: hypothetical protein VM598_08465 [Bdellovibrionota bacterium]|nr:hypothetical protein [Bdellovibrionota bacterium]